MAGEDQSSTGTVEQQLAALQRRLEASEEQRQATEARLRAAEEQTRLSTFVEMLDLHHQHTFKPLKVLRPAQSTKGTYKSERKILHHQAATMDGFSFVAARTL